MATTGLALTFNDLRKRQKPDGTIDEIIEVLQQDNPILEDIPWMEGNLPTGTMTTQRTSIPEPSLRAINRGVKPNKSSTKQVTDTCCMLEGRSEIDVELLALQGANKIAFRQSEDIAHIEGFSNKVASMLFYGDSDKNLDEFNGFEKRYNAYGGKLGDTSYQVVNAGGKTEKKETSIWLVNWGERNVYGIYPKDSDMHGSGNPGVKVYKGFYREDLAEYDATSYDADGKPTGKYRVVGTLFKWKPGLAVRDPRQVAAVRNIDLTELNKSTTAASSKRAVIDTMIDAKNLIRNLNAGNPYWYVSRGFYSFLEKYLMDKNNVYVTRSEMEDGKPVLRFNGIPVRRVDALSETEDIITEKK